MELDPSAAPLRLEQWDGTLIRNTELVRFRPGVDPTDVVFETGHADAAQGSYKIFRALRDAAIIPQGMRFQVALPSPMASGYIYVSPAALDDYLATYERALLQALLEIVRAIPASDLSIQWDICQEVLIFADYFPQRPADYTAQIFTEMGRLGNAVPEPVELGYHFCYGTPKDEHLVMPKDLSIAVEMINGLGKVLNRPLDYVHVPVPKDRTDRAYFARLGSLDLNDATDLYLGLVHCNDGDGDRARIAAAEKVTRRFGVSTECGWGRTDPARVSSLIAAHRRIMESD